MSSVSQLESYLERYLECMYFFKTTTTTTTTNIDFNY